MSRSGREVHSEVRESTGGPPGSPGVVGVPPGCPGVVRRSFRKSGSVRDGLTDVREWSGGPPTSLGVVERSCLKFGLGQEDLPDVRVW